MIPQTSIYPGRRGPQMYLKVRLPKHGGFEDGPSVGIKKFFCNNYNRLREMLSPHSCHLRSETGIAIPDEDAISGYVGYGGLIYVVDGSAPFKDKGNELMFWGHSVFSGPKGDAPAPMLSLARRRVVGLSVGTEHAAVVSEGGRVFTWGINDFGQLGTGDEQPRPLPTLTELPYEVFISQVACGGRYTLGLEKKGVLWSWGRFQASNFPRNFVETWCNGYEVKGEKGMKGEKLVKIAAGDMHMAALTKEGRLFTWGYNDFGQLGWGLSGKDRTGQQKPHPVNLPEPATHVACGGAHTVVVTGSNHVYGWGSNVNGQLGHGLRQVFPEPQHIQLGDPIQSASAGWQATLYITTKSKSLICGGIMQSGPSDLTSMKTDGEEKEGDPPAPSSTAQVTDLLSGGQQMSEEGISTGCIGEAHGLLLADSGVVKAWGYNRQKQCLGVETKDTFVDRPTEVEGFQDGQVVCVAVDCGGAATYALVKGKKEC